MLLARAGDEVAVTEVVQRLRPLVTDIARRYFLAGGDRSDVLQEGFIGLYRAVCGFDPAAGVPFRAFAAVCVRNQIQNAVAAATRRKHEPLNTGVPLSSALETGAMALPHLGPDAPEDPAEVVALREARDQLAHFLSRVLTPLEREVLDGFLDGASYDSIAASVDRSAKAVDNALQRIRRKVEQRYVAAAA